MDTIVSSWKELSKLNKIQIKDIRTTTRITVASGEALELNAVTNVVIVEHAGNNYIIFIDAEKGTFSSSSMILIDFWNSINEELDGAEETLAIKITPHISAMGKRYLSGQLIAIDVL